MQVRNLIRLLVGKEMDNTVLVYDGIEYKRLESTQICNGLGSLVINAIGPFELRQRIKVLKAKSAKAIDREIAKDDRLERLRRKLREERKENEHCQDEIRKMDRHIIDVRSKNEQLVDTVKSLRTKVKELTEENAAMLRQFNDQDMRQNSEWCAATLALMEENEKLYREGRKS